jgi:murein L,D-transpeptidase YafK
MSKIFSLFVLVFFLSSCDSNALRVPKVIYESSIKADSIIADKSDKKLYLLKNGKIIREYSARIGSIPGKKMYEGDNRTPEGRYFISNKNPNSQYFLSLAISYPNKEDVARARAMGKKPGGDIMIHGMPNKAGLIERFKNQYEDWTAGCIAVKDKDMVEIYAMVDVHTPILIRP